MVVLIICMYRFVAQNNFCTIMNIATNICIARLKFHIILHQQHQEYTADVRTRLDLP